MSEHTPGPWLAVVDGSGWSIETDDKFLAFTCGGPDGEEISEDEEAANACLIAAAPELLRELKKQAAEMEKLAGQLRLYGFHDLPAICDLMAKSARAAIAKAEAA